MDNETAEQYISYLKESFILFDTGMRNALERITKLSEADLGYIIEDVLQQHTLWNAESESISICYWRKKEEVDIIVEIGREIIPLEAKYKNNISLKDLAGLIKFMRIHKIKQGIVVTKDMFELKNSRLRRDIKHKCPQCSTKRHVVCDGIRQLKINIITLLKTQNSSKF